MRTAVTVSLVNEARGGPFVFWDDLWGAVAEAKRLGFDAIEIFAPGPDAVDRTRLKRELDATGLKVAAVGTGGGWVLHKLTLTSPDASIRRRAIDFIASMIDFGADFQAPAIIGSMQGRWGDGVSKEQALTWLVEALVELGRRAESRGVGLFYEPLNRYETNLVTRLDDGVALLKRTGIASVKLLADLFHMNIEETNTSQALIQAGDSIGHVHFVDSNRRPAGLGQTRFTPIVEALRSIGYQGYLSAEAFAYPDPLGAAKQTIDTMKRTLAT